MVKTQNYEQKFMKVNTRQFIKINTKKFLNRQTFKKCTLKFLSLGEINKVQTKYKYFKKILKIIIHKVQGEIKSAFENICKEFQKIN